MKYNKLTGYAGVLVLFAWLSGPALAHSDGDDEGDGRNGSHSVRATLSGFQEVPALSSSCEGRFHARISNDESQIEFELSYANLEGSVQQAHIHFGQKGVNAGISVFLCSNLGNGPAGTQLCPIPSGTITGVIRAANIIGPAGQGIAAGEIQELIEAIHAGKAYANVHSTLYPLGECRGQIR